MLVLSATSHPPPAIPTRSPRRYHRSPGRGSINAGTRPRHSILWSGRWVVLPEGPGSRWSAFHWARCVTRTRSWSALHAGTPEPTPVLRRVQGRGGSNSVCTPRVPRGFGSHLSRCLNLGGQNTARADPMPNRPRRATAPTTVCRIDAGRPRLPPDRWPITNRQHGARHLAHARKPPPPNDSADNTALPNPFLAALSSKGEGHLSTCPTFGQRKARGEAEPQGWCGEWRNSTGGQPRSCAEAATTDRHTGDYQRT